MAKGGGSAAARKRQAEAATPVSDWKKDAAGELIELPSGKKAVLRRPRAFAMIAKDEIPNPLLNIVMESSGISDPKPDSESGDSDVAAFITWTVARTFVEPRLFWPDPEKPDEEPPADWLTIDDLEDGDIMFVFGWSQQIDLSALEAAAGDLRPFLAGASGASDGRDGEGVRPAAEQPA